MIQLAAIAIPFLSRSEIIGIECAHGRGKIMAGGKWEEGETFAETARRELREETGIYCDFMEYVFGGMAETGYYTYAFIAHCRLTDLRESVGRFTEAGEVCVMTFEDMKKSKFKGYYEVLEQIINRRTTVMG